ncbi:MAG: ribosomal protein L7/L12 [Dysgonomonas sp.]
MRHVLSPSVCRRLDVVYFSSAAIRAIKTITGLSIADCTEIADNPPAYVLRFARESEATNAKNLLEAARATVEVNVATHYK